MSERGSPGSKLVLGTVQFGLAYGITNQRGVPDNAELTSILATAARAGVEWLDTARAYGNAEERLGEQRAAQSFRIVTKVEPLDALMASASLDDAGAAATLSIQRSLAALGTRQVDVAMLHLAHDWDKPGVRNALVAAREAGTIGAVGVSVYTPQEAIQCLSDPAIAFLQLPCHALDRRWRDAGFLAARNARPDVTVHARSVFLQGLLLAPVDQWPAWVDERQPLVRLLEEAAAPLFGGLVELCLRHHRSLDWIDATVVGVASVDHLQGILSAASDDPLNPETLTLLDDAATLVSARLLDPRSW